MVQWKVIWNYTLLSVPYIVRYDKSYNFPCFVNISEVDTTLYKVGGCMSPCSYPTQPPSLSDGYASKHGQSVC
jgi:hypothetical protein